MRFRCLAPKVVVCLLTSLIPAAFGQDSASLSGDVIDAGKAIVVGASLTLTDSQRGAVRTTKTDDLGKFTFHSLQPGTYSLLLQSKGFADLRLDSLKLTVRERRSLKLELTVATNSTPVTVPSDGAGITADASMGIVLESDYFLNLPLNSRNATSMLQLAPGITLGAGTPGGLDSNGLRSNTNYYWLDGASLSGDTSMGSGVMGGGPGGVLGGGPGGGVGGGLDSLSLDSLQEVRVQTIAYAPEFGRTSGAQIATSTRAGTNEFHGSVFEYYRNDAFNANDWFANAAGLTRGNMSQNEFGGTIGGPIARNRTFFFFSTDLLYLQTPTTSVASVPGLDARAAAPATLRPYLRAFPIPNGPELAPGTARFSAVTTNPEHRQFYSARLDHSFNEKNNLFVRYAYTPAEMTRRGSEFISPNVISTFNTSSQSITAGWTKTISPDSTNELRASYWTNSFNSTGTMDNFGGAIPLNEALVFPSGVNSSNGSFTLSTLGLASYGFGLRGGNDQKQFNLVDGYTINAGAHTYKMGFDIRTLFGTSGNAPYSSLVVFNGLAGGQGSLLSGLATMSSVSSNVPNVYPYTINWSAYIQDAWRINAGTTVTFGVRWDVNPAPSVWQGEKPYALTPINSDYVTQSQSLYNTNWYAFAPRVGMVRQTRWRDSDLIIRGGFGFFYDPGYGTSMSAFGGAPYSNIRTTILPQFPLSAGVIAPPGLPATKPFGTVGTAELGLKPPAIMAWDIALDRMYGPDQALTIAYVGTRGSRLLRTTTEPAFSPDYNILRLVTNEASSSYEALQVQFRRRAARNLQAQVSYTYSHSIDTGSTDIGGADFANLYSGERASSNYDIRHNLNASASYLLPSPKSGAMAAALRNWWTQFMFVARTGSPFDVVGISGQSSGTGSGSAEGGLFALVRPNYTGADVWLNDPYAPGGRRLNPAAFEVPSSYTQGSLGRNAINGFGMLQLDFSLRRQIFVRERQSIGLSVMAFNILNQPSFANPSYNMGANMASANFGVSTRPQYLGNEGMGGSLLQTGGPRSLQFVIRYQF